MAGVFIALKYVTEIENTMKNFPEGIIYSITGVPGRSLTRGILRTKCVSCYDAISLIDTSFPYLTPPRLRPKKRPICYLTSLFDTCVPAKKEYAGNQNLQKSASFSFKNLRI